MKFNSFFFKKKLTIQNLQNNIRKKSTHTIKIIQFFLQKSKWPINARNCFNTKISKIVEAQQKLICYLALINSTELSKVQRNYVTSLINRIYSIQNITDIIKLNLINFSNITFSSKWKINKLGKLTLKALKIYKNVIIKKKIPFRIQNSNKLLLHNKIIQLLFKIIILPVTEAFADSESYGFRPGRNKKMAIARVILYLQNNTINKFFILKYNMKNVINIQSSKFILKKLPMPQDTKFILNFWLKFEQKKKFFLNSYNDIIRPLLLNFLFDGIEQEIISLSRDNLKKNNWWSTEINISIIRYVTNLLILIKKRTLLLKIKIKIDKFIKKRNLFYKPLKGFLIKIIPKTTFIFLGFEFISYININKKQVNFKISKYPKFFYKKIIWFIRPHILQIKIFFLKIKKLTINKNLSISKLIQILNFWIQNWGNYFLIGNYIKTFRYVDYLIWKRVNFWILKKYSKYSKSKIMEKFLLLKEKKNFFLVKKWQFRVKQKIKNNFLNKKKVLGLIQLRAMKKSIPFSFWLLKKKERKIPFYLIT